METVKIKVVDAHQGYDITKTYFYQGMLNNGYQAVISDDPDYLICKDFGHEALKKKYDNCIKIMVSGECRSIDFNLYDYGIGVEWMQFEDRYLRFPEFLVMPDRWNQTMGRILQKEKNVSETMKGKTGFCSFVYSNGNTADPIREQFFYKLSEYKKVDSGGRYLNNIGQPNGVADKLTFEQAHKFSIAFENVSHPGYLCEKLTESFAAHTVPIYWGDPRVKEIFNEKAMICASDYPTLEALAERVKQVDQDDALYAQMLAQPAFLVPEDNTVEAWQKKVDAFVKNIMDQPKEQAFRRCRFAYEEQYLLEMRHAFYPTPIRDAGRQILQVAKSLVPVETKRKLKEKLKKNE